MNEWFWVWLALAVILSVAEIFTGGFFMLPFGAGAAVAAALEYFGAPILWQWIAFLGLSSVLLIGLRRFSDHITHEPPVRMGAARLIGQEGVVIQTLKAHSLEGQIRVDREDWRAETVTDIEVPVGARVVVEAIEGTHLIVKPVVTDEATQ